MLGRWDSALYYEMCPNMSTQIIIVFAFNIFHEWKVLENEFVHLTRVYGITSFIGLSHSFISIWLLCHHNLFYNEKSNLQFQNPTSHVRHFISYNWQV
jgi:hypothetical protein